MAQIMLIEPDAGLAKIYKKALASAGHKIMLAASAQQAVTLADHQRPDLVLLELLLVGHNGLEFLYEFRSYPDWQNVPVLVNSLIPAKEFNTNMILWHQLGVGEYFYKPKTSLWQLLHGVEIHLQLQPNSRFLNA